MKSVLGLQLKTVCGRVMSGENKTDSGEDIDMIFGYTSVSNRIVESTMMMGTANTLLKLITKEVIDIYHKDKMGKKA